MTVAAVSYIELIAGLHQRRILSLEFLSFLRLQGAGPRLRRDSGCLSILMNLARKLDEEEGSLPTAPLSRMT